MRPEGVVDLGPQGLLNLIGQRIRDIEKWCPWYWLPGNKVLAVIPNPVTDIQLHYTKQGRRLLITTRFGRYKVIPRNGRSWRVKKVPSGKRISERRPFEICPEVLSPLVALPPGRSLGVGDIVSIVGDGRYTIESAPPRPDNSVDVWMWRVKKVPA